MFLSLFLVFVPRRNRVYLPFWPCVLSFWRFAGVPFWAPGVLAIFGFSRYLGGGLSLLAPLLRPFFWRRGGKGASLLLVPVFVFPFLFCGCAPFLEARVGVLAEVGITGRFLRGGLVPSISGILTAYSGSHKVTGTPWAFLSGEGRFICVFFPAPGFTRFLYIYISAGPWGPEYRDAEFRALLRELPETLR